MLYPSFILFLGATVFLQTAAVVLAHPESVEELQLVKRHTEKAARALESCHHKLLKSRALHTSRFTKREEWINSHVQKRGIKRRNQPQTGLNWHVAGLDERSVGCILTPQTTLGQLARSGMDSQGYSYTDLISRPILDGRDVSCSGPFADPWMAWLCSGPFADPGHPRMAWAIHG